MNERATEALSDADTLQGRSRSVASQGSRSMPTAQAKLVNVALEGMLPFMMREGGGVSPAGDAEMERDCPLPSTRTVATTTNPVVKVS
jgi:hypothetical protein